MHTGFTSQMQDAISGQILPAGPIQALLLDDDAYDRTRIRRYTEKTGLTIELDEAPSIKCMSEMLRDKSYDLIMVDYRLAEGTGLDALEVIRDQGRNTEAAIIMITGDEQSQTAVTAFRSGCHDFLNKGELSPVVLQTSMEGALLRSREALPTDAEISAKLEAHLERAMTNVLGGDQIQQALTQRLREAAQSSGLSLEIMNIDELESYLADDEFIFKH
ncbi:response regulator receiver domain-containing protein [Litoreibacter ponti]|uniref:Response regulator receiver domain-containing protein n=1 Tax=Litoreibacter ponti TaxID=1510457 RepID=A0A2T6BLZ5_9RHOB|nr:response regulator [Litoreibacter ponti]PTX57081.1 response regulator receiver domain-containing protein [Litoreibacter ponti]